MNINLLENENMSPLWKAFHITFLALAALFGIIGGIILSLIYETEYFLCGVPLLRTSPLSVPGSYFIELNNSYIVLDFTSWGLSDPACDFSQYTLITSFICGLIWMVFFMMCGRGGKSEVGLPQPWRIVLPSLIFSTIFFIVTLAAGVQLSMAISKFCSKFDKDYENIRNITRTTSRCYDLDMFIKMDFVSVQTLMNVAEAMSWLCFVAWGGSMSLCIARMLTGPDFLPVLKPLHEVDATPAPEGEGYKKLSSTSYPSSSKSDQSTKIVLKEGAKKNTDLPIKKRAVHSFLGESSGIMRRMSSPEQHSSRDFIVHDSEKEKTLKGHLSLGY